MPEWARKQGELLAHSLGTVPRRQAGEGDTWLPPGSNLKWKAADSDRLAYPADLASCLLGFFLWLLCSLIGQLPGPKVGGHGRATFAHFAVALAPLSRLPSFLQVKPELGWRGTILVLPHSWQPTLCH